MNTISRFRASVPKTLTDHILTIQLSCATLLLAGAFFIFWPFLVQAADADVRINEFSSAGSEEWVELYNEGDAEVSLAGWTLIQHTGGELTGTSTFAALPSSIAAGEYLVIEGDGLNDGGDVITLLNTANVEIDTVAYGDAANANVSAPGADETGAFIEGDWEISTFPTPGAENALEEPCAAVILEEEDSCFTSLEDAIGDAEDGETILISGTIGAVDDYTAYEITAPITLQGEEGAKVYGSFIIKTDGVTVDGLTMYTRGGGNGPLKTAIDVIAKKVTITNNVFELPNPEAVASEGGVGNGVTIWPHGEGEVDYDVSGNTFTGYDADTSDWSSSAFQIAEGLGLSRFDMDDDVSEVVDLDPETEKELASGNTYIGSSNNYVHSNWSSGVSYKYVLASTEAQLGSLQYMADNATLLLGDDITVLEQFTIDRPIIVDGNGFSLNAGYAFDGDQSNNSVVGIIGTDEVTLQNLVVDGTEGTGLHGVNVYESTAVTLEDVTLSNNSKSGMTVNGSVVTATNLNTEGNSWGAVNVDPGSGVTDPSMFTLVSGDLADLNQIWSDGNNVIDTATVTVIVPEDYDEYPVFGTTKIFWTNKTPANVAMIGDVVYSSIEAAVEAVTSGGIVTLGAGTYEENIVVDKPLTIRGAGSGETNITAGSSGEPGENNTAIFIKSSEVSVEGLSLIGTGSSQNRGITLLGGIGSIVVDDVEASGFVTGIYINPGVSASISDYYAHDNTVGIGSDGVAHVVVEDSRFIENTAEGIGSSDVQVGGLSITRSSFIDTGVGVAHYGGPGTIGATNNWWGSTEPDFETVISGDVTHIPWYINSSRTILSSTVSGGTLTTDDEEVTVDAGEEEGEAALPAGVTELALGNSTSLDLSAGTKVTGDRKEVTLKSGTDNTPVVLKNSTMSNVSVTIPDNTKISGPANWDGKIQPPKTEAPSGTAPAGFSVGGTVITVGSSNGTLLFDEPVELLLEGVTGTVGYKPAGSDTWIEITEQCEGSYNNPGEPSDDEGECYISNGTDTKIVTFHFTSFGSLVTTSSESSGGGGGFYSGSISSDVTEEETTGVIGEGAVLGASTYRFSTDMTIGARGAQVVELQERLRAEGFFTFPTSTGYFGPITQEAVKQYQTAHGISATGFVGPLTRASLNASTSTKNPVVQAQLDTLRLQAVALMQQLVVRLQAQLENN